MVGDDAHTSAPFKRAINGRTLQPGTSGADALADLSVKILPMIQIGEIAEKYELQIKIEHPAEGADLCHVTREGGFLCENWLTCEYRHQTLFRKFRESR